ncbi:MAG: methionine--tRNA ligase [Bdellovibrionales bacterium]
MKPFYITTPIYYVNDKPHLGTAYCTITADVLSRFHRLFGEETFFLTGTDEHGQKVQQAAEKRGISPQQHCDEMVRNFQDTWKALDVEYTHFIRTTSKTHAEVVQRCLQSLYDKGDIYADVYEGWYSVSEEIFYTEKELVDGKSPTGKDVSKIQEKNYFFRMSKYQDRLIRHIEDHPRFILPDFRKNEVLGFLRQPLADLCISRPKSRLSWGVEIPFDREYVTYVWFDALLNYCTGVGLYQPGREADFQKWWVDAGALHLIGKDILTTHSVYWTTMLMALGLPLPRQIFATGWILNKDNAKMSKSAGDVVAPVDIRDIFGLDELRYFLVRDIHLGNDAPFSLDLVESRVNSELANNLGNLLSRTTNLVEKFFGGQKPALREEDESGRELRSRALRLPALVKKEVEDLRPSFALEHIVQVLSLANRYLEEKAPWKMAKEDLPGAGHVLATTLEVIRVAGTLLSPVMPGKTEELLKRIGIESLNWEDLEKWPVLRENAPIRKGDPLFPRLDLSHLKG